MEYPDQLTKKEQSVRDALSFFPDWTLADSIPSPTQKFRNRAKMSVTGTLEKPIVGLVGQTPERRGAAKKILRMDSLLLDVGRELLACPIHHPELNRLIAAMPELIKEYRLIPYRIGKREGELKGLIAFYSPQSHEMYLRFILRSKACIEAIKKLVPDLQKRFPTLTCISANIQPIPHAILEGPEEIILSERHSIVHQLADLRLQLSPQAFVQTNVEVATLLYQTAADWIREAQVDRVLELFCGQGAFSFFAARNAQEFLGIEINSEAVQTANETAKQLGLIHLKFKQADATQVKEEIKTFRPDLILANPPRRGLSTGVALILESRPAQFLYSSCSIGLKELRSLIFFHIRAILRP
jgi:23S rRNA (uracil747-C5)-methyltransferase